jgi:hypothetical protein
VLGGGQFAGRGRILGGQQLEPERGLALQPLVALPGRGVEVELEDPCGLMWAAEDTASVSPLTGRSEGG